MFYSSLSSFWRKSIRVINCFIISGKNIGISGDLLCGFDVQTDAFFLWNSQFFLLFVLSVDSTSLLLKYKHIKYVAIAVLHIIKSIYSSFKQFKSSKKLKCIRINVDNCNGWSFRSFSARSWFILSLSNIFFTSLVIVIHVNN